MTSQNWREDYSTKRNEYSRLDIPEYWIVDSERSRVRLCSKISGESSYAERDFLPGDEVNSAQFPGLILPVARILDQPDVDYLVREELRLRQELEELERQINAERQRAEAAIQRAEQLAQYLQALGIDPDTIN